jgi:hypothetical protein
MTSGIGFMNLHDTPLTTTLKGVELTINKKDLLNRNLTLLQSNFEESKLTSLGISSDGAGHIVESNR